MGWRWPIVGAGVLVSLGCIAVVFMDGKHLDGLDYTVIGFSILVVALALGHSLSPHPAIAWSLRIGVMIQALGLSLLLAFLLFFKMDRLF